MVRKLDQSDSESKERGSGVLSWKVNGDAYMGKRC